MPDNQGLDNRGSTVTYQELSTTITSGAGNAFIHMNAHATSNQPDGAMTITFIHYGRHPTW